MVRRKRFALVPSPLLLRSRWSVYGEVRYDIACVANADENQQQRSGPECFDSGCRRARERERTGEDGAVRDERQNVVPGPILEIRGIRPKPLRSQHDAHGVYQAVKTGGAKQNCWTEQRTPR